MKTWLVLAKHRQFSFERLRVSGLGFRGSFAGLEVPPPFHKKNHRSSGHYNKDPTVWGRYYETPRKAINRQANKTLIPKWHPPPPERALRATLKTLLKPPQTPQIQLYLDFALEGRLQAGGGGAASSRRFRVQGIGFRVLDLGFRAWG